jgi:hypothetical protein
MNQYQFRVVQIPRWQAILIGVVVLGALLALFVLALGVFLLVLPVILIAGAVMYFFGGKSRANMPPWERNVDDGRVIEAEYREVDETRRKLEGKDG